jgi:hypothetical protein
MAAINDLNLILHNIRVRLYPNYLPAAKGKYLARTDSDKTVNVKDICTIMVTRLLVIAPAPNGAENRIEIRT